MPVDRALRDKLADLLAAYLRGGDGRELRQQLKALSSQVGAAHDDGFPPRREYFPETEDEAAKDAWESLWIDMRSGRGAWTASEWHSDCRLLAFLNSDLVDAAEVKWDGEEFGPREVWAARGHLVLIAAAIAVSFLVGLWWLYLAAAAASQLVFTISMNICDRRRQQPHLHESVWPFATPEEWNAQRHWLAELRIPAYDRATHAAPWRQQVLTGLMIYAVMGCFVLFSLTMAPLWPIWLLLVACTRGKMNQ